jgi:hypothetical protein
MKTWYSGCDNFIKHTITDINDGIHAREHHLEIQDVDYDPNLTLAEVFNDNLSSRATKTVEVLFSGGLDSEATIRACNMNGIPVRALTMDIRLHGLSINTHDLYYAEKYCRENAIKQKIITLDATKFFENGEHIKYLEPYHIVEPHVATHFWLFEQALGYPVIGGDWPWLQHYPKRQLSPWRLNFVSYDKFLEDKSIDGIGNMIGRSLSSCYKMVQEHYNITKQNKYFLDPIHVNHFKKELYNNLGIAIKEPRFRNYGWEILYAFPDLFNMNQIKSDLENRFGLTKNVITWNKVLAQAAEMLPGTNDTFS